MSTILHMMLKHHSYFLIFQKQSVFNNKSKQSCFAAGDGSNISKPTEKQHVLLAETSSERREDRSVPCVRQGSGTPLQPSWLEC